MNMQKVRNDMAKMNFDEEGLLEEPCLSCDKGYIDNLFYEWCCDEKECQYTAESEADCHSCKTEYDCYECDKYEESEVKE